MKTKGITIWEQHLEHFVLGAAVLVFIGFTAMQFIGEPNAVDMAGKKVGPGEVDRMLDEHAKEIQERIGPAAESPFKLERPEPVIEKFQAQREAAVSPAPTIFAAQRGDHPGKGILAAKPTDKPFVVATVPAPTSLVTRQYFDTLAPDLVAQHEGLQTLLPKAPHDINFTTVAATFAAKSVLDQFANGGSKGEVALPPKWFDGRVDPIDLRLEREEYLPDGSWGNLVLLNQIPGQLSFRKELAGKIDNAMKNEIVKTVAEPAGRSQIIQPEFYPGIANAWAAPDGKKPEANVPVVDDPAANLKNTLAKLRKDRAGAEKRMKDNNCPEQAPEPPKKPGKPPADPGGAGRGGGGGGGGGAPPKAPPGSGGGLGSGGGFGPPDEGGRGKGNENVCRGLRDRLKKINDQIAKAEAALQEMEGAAAKPADQPVAELIADASSDQWIIWAHDITVVAGKTYRYRMTLEIFNPLFAHKVDLMSAQQQMAEKFTLVSQVSEWSEPMLIDPPLQVYVTAANVDGGMLNNLGFGNVTAEVYRYFDGRWWGSDFNAQPGDRIGGTKPGTKDDKAAAPIDFSTDWFVLDIVKLVGADQMEENRNWAANVVLQALNGDLMQIRSPRVDSQDPERAARRRDVQLAEAGNAVAAK